MPAPLGLLAELTHRCPLGCPYCSNPLALDKRDDELETALWARVVRDLSHSNHARLGAHPKTSPPACRSSPRSRSDFHSGQRGPAPTSHCALQSRFPAQTCSGERSRPSRFATRKSTPLTPTHPN